MPGVYPNSGVPAAQTSNGVDVDSENCAGNELFYSVIRCQPRFDPAAMNAVISEILNLATCDGEAYDCSRLDNLCRAVTALSGIQPAVVGFTVRPGGMVYCEDDQVYWNSTGSDVVLTGTSCEDLGSDGLTAINAAPGGLFFSAPIIGAGTEGVPYTVREATELLRGSVRLASALEVNAGTNTTAVVTPAGLAQWLCNLEPLTGPEVASLDGSELAAICFEDGPRSLTLDQLATVVGGVSQNPFDYPLSDPLDWSLSNSSHGGSLLGPAAPANAPQQGVWEIRPFGEDVEGIPTIFPTRFVLPGGTTSPPLDGNDAQLVWRPTGL
jgi:hypothetical protein